MKDLEALLVMSITGFGGHGHLQGSINTVCCSQHRGTGQCKMGIITVGQCSPCVYHMSICCHCTWPDLPSLLLKCPKTGGGNEATLQGHSHLSSTAMTAFRKIQNWVSVES